jgi:hypothetical protein
MRKPKKRTGSLGGAGGAEAARPPNVFWTFLFSGPALLTIFDAYFEFTHQHGVRPPPLLVFIALACVFSAVVAVLLSRAASNRTGGR